MLNLSLVTYFPLPSDRGWVICWTGIQSTQEVEYASRELC
jgi:hypothetical protein